MELLDTSTDDEPVIIPNSDEEEEEEDIDSENDMCLQETYAFVISPNKKKGYTNDLSNKDQQNQEQKNIENENHSQKYRSHMAGAIRTHIYMNCMKVLCGKRIMVNATDINMMIIKLLLNATSGKNEQNYSMLIKLCLK